MNKRRPRGDGSVMGAGPGRWRLRYAAPSESGERRQTSETVRGSKAHATQTLRTRLRAIETGEFVNPSKIRVERYMRDWLKSHAENVSPKTVEGYGCMLRNYVIPAFGSIKLQSIEPRHLSALYLDMSERGLSSSTRAHCHRTIRKALGDAMKQGLIVRNPALAVTPPKQRRNEPNMWTADQFQDFLSAAVDDEFRDFFEIAALTGLRRSEMAGLRWVNVNLDERSLRVTESLQRIAGRKLVVSTPKSHKSRRPVALSARAIELLKSVRIQQLERQVAAGEAYEESGYVFTNALGQPVDSGRASKHFLKVVRAAELPEVSLHSLRHLHATLLLAAGVNVKVLSERLGHSSVAFTMDIYVDSLPGFQEQAADAIDEALATS